MKLLLQQNKKKFLEIENVEMKMLETVCMEARATQRCLLKYVVARKNLRTLMRKKLFIASVLFMFKIIVRSNAMLAQFKNALLNTILMRQRSFRRRLEALIAHHFLLDRCRLEK